MHDLTCLRCGKSFTHKRKREYCGRQCANVDRNDILKSKRNNIPRKTVWSCGGGVQSTAIAVLICQGKLPIPDYAVMIDCGYEKSQTWEYVHNTIVPNLKEHGVELNILKTNDWSDNNLFDKQNHIRLPLFINNNGKQVKFDTHCNQTWKVMVIKRWMRSKGIEACEGWLGISSDERRRARSSPNDWYSYRYPLLDMGLDREDCIYLIAAAGWSRPHHTSCFCCPNQKDRQWQDMKEAYPIDWQRAIEVEKQIQSVMPNAYLHRSMVPLHEVELKC